MVVIVDVSILRVGYDLATLRFEASLLLLLQQRLVAPPLRAVTLRIIRATVECKSTTPHHHTLQTTG